MERSAPQAAGCGNQWHRRSVYQRSARSELHEVLAYPKFTNRLSANVDSVDRCVGRFMAIANLTPAATIEGAVTADPDDDHVIACALSAKADAIVSGDAHLLDLKSYQGIRIITAATALALIGNV